MPAVDKSGGIRMKINGTLPMQKLEGKCATCKHYIPLIKKIYGIVTLCSRGKCSIRKYKDGWNVYKQRTETCIKWKSV